MSWLYSQALVEEYLGDICLDGEQSVQSNGNPTQQAYLSQDKMTKFSRLSRFGMTFKPLMEDLGKELLTLYLGAFHARTSQQQEKAQELTENDQECGKKWQGSLAKYNPNTSSWKTAQCSLFEDLELSLETFQRWGSMRNGELYQRQTLVLPISENESGLLQRTPDNETFFHTPLTTGMDGGSNSRKALKKKIKMWPTPVATESNGSAAFKLTDAVDATLGRTMPAMQKKVEKWKEFEKWPTPKAVDGIVRHSQKWMEKKWNEGGDVDLTIAVKMREKESTQMWPTPVCQDSRHAVSRHLDPNNEFWKSNLGEVVMSIEPVGITGRLNPTWVEWLMGWPQEWTDLKPLEMDKFQEWQQQHGHY